MHIHESSDSSEFPCWEKLMTTTKWDYKTQISAGDATSGFPTSEQRRNLQCPDVGKPGDVWPSVTPSWMFQKCWVGTSVEWLRRVSDFVKGQPISKIYFFLQWCTWPWWTNHSASIILDWCKKIRTNQTREWHTPTVALPLDLLYNELRLWQGPACR